MIGNIELLSRLVLTALLGSVIGVERERMNWAAGLRTHMLACVGAALMTLVSAFGFADVLAAKNVVLDPSWIAAQVVSGIGFLGAGSIELPCRRENFRPVLKHSLNAPLVPVTCYRVGSESQLAAP